MKESQKEEFSFHYKIAETFFDLSFGLMFKKEIPHNFGLWFKLKRKKDVIIHTFFMRFPIDIIFFDENQAVIRIIRNMKPWRIVKVNGVKEFLEVRGGTV